jgi:hypothetical protein
MQNGMSALPPIADMCGALADVRFGPIADIQEAIEDIVLGGGWLPCLANCGRPLLQNQRHD